MARMNTEAEVLDATHYSAKLAELSNIFIDPKTKKPLPYAEVGRQLYKTCGCAQCHSVDGTPGQGPTWQGLYKQTVEFSSAPPGYTLTAADDGAKWDAYLRESILDPGPRSSAAIRTSCRPGQPIQRQRLQGKEAGGHRRIHQEPGQPRARRQAQVLPPHADPQEWRGVPPGAAGVSPVSAASTGKMPVPPSAKEEVKKQ